MEEEYIGQMILIGYYFKRINSLFCNYTNTVNKLVQNVDNYFFYNYWTNI